MVKSNMNDIKNLTAPVGAVRLPRKPQMPYFPPGTPVAESKPISSTLKALKVGDIAVFPIEQLTSVQSTKNRLVRNYMRQGWNAEVIVNEDEYTVTVRRTS